MTKSAISGMNRQIISLKFTQMSRIYLSIYRSIYLSALEDILIMIIYLLTGRPDARKTHTQPGRPDFFFVALNSLKYGKKFTKHLVKIGSKLVLNSFSSIKLQNPRLGGGGGYSQYSHIRTVRVCAARKPPPHRPPPLIFRTWLLYCFDVDHSKSSPFQKYTILCSAFPTRADRKDRRFKNIYVSLLFLTPKSPDFPVRGRSESTAPPPSPRIFSEGPLLKPLIFKQCAANIYQFHI